MDKTKVKFSEVQLICGYPFVEPRRNAEKILVDVGAHEGGVTKRFAKLNWKVIAFEPEQNNRSIFLSHHASNSNITCIPKAVTDTDGQTIPFYISDKHYGIHSIRPFHNTHHQASYPVETITLKTALEEQRINHVSFLKIDTEGADFLALKGFDWSRIKPEVVMVEFMDDRSERNFNYTHHDMASFMKERGYTCFVSEWEPIVQYGIKGQTAEPHRWVQCVKYPLDHIPSWGNLIFVPEKDETKFVKTLEKYLRDLSNRESPGSFQHLVLQMKRFVKRTFFN